MAMTPASKQSKFEEMVEAATASAEKDKEKTKEILTSTGGKTDDNPSSTNIEKKTDSKKKDAKPKKRLVLNVSDEMYAAVERYSKVSGISMSGVGCKAIYDFLVANNITLF